MEKFMIEKIEEIAVENGRLKKDNEIMFNCLEELRRELNSLISNEYYYENSIRLFNMSEKIISILNNTDGIGVIEIEEE